MTVDGSDIRMVSTGKGVTTCGFFFPDRSRLLYSSTHLSGPDCLRRPDRSGGYAWALYPEYEIYSADLHGGNLVRLTYSPGYDTEAAISPDGQRVIFTSLRGGDLDLYLMDADGGNVRQVTDVGAASFAVAMHPSDRQIIFSSNLTDPRRRDFALCLVNVDGTGLELVTHAATFASFPMFSPDGKRLVFTSNRNAKGPREFNIFIADWIG